MKILQKKNILKRKENIIPENFLEEKQKQIESFLENRRETKFKMILVCQMGYKYESKVKAYFTLKHKSLYKDVIKDILNKIISYQNNGSGWYFEKVLWLEIHAVNYKPLKGSCYLELPDFI